MSIKKLAANIYSKLTKQAGQGQAGQGLVEYVLLTTIIAISLISSLMLLKDTVLNVLNAIPYLSSGRF